MFRLPDVRRRTLTVAPTAAPSKEAERAHHSTVMKRAHGPGGRLDRG
jgi:hypothetical protein